MLRCYHKFYKSILIRNNAKIFIILQFVGRLLGLIPTSVHLGPLGLSLQPFQMNISCFMYCMELHNPFYQSIKKFSQCGRGWSFTLSRNTILATPFSHSWSKTLAPFGIVHREAGGQRARATKHSSRHVNILARLQEKWSWSQFVVDHIAPLSSRPAKCGEIYSRGVMPLLWQRYHMPGVSAVTSGSWGRQRSRRLEYCCIMHYSCLHHCITGWQHSACTLMHQRNLFILLNLKLDDLVASTLWPACASSAVWILIWLHALTARTY